MMLRREGLMTNVNILRSNLPNYCMKEKVIEIMKDVLETEDISLNTSKENCENWNSLRHLNLVSELEEAFNMEFEPEEIADMHSVNSIIDIVQKKL